MCVIYAPLYSASTLSASVTSRSLSLARSLSLESSLCLFMFFRLALVLRFVLVDYHFLGFSVVVLIRVHSWWKIFQALNIKVYRIKIDA